MDNESDKMQIDIPEINFAEIESIVDKGVKPKISFANYVKNSFRELGVRNIFHDKVELLMIVLISMILLLISLVNLSDYNIRGAYKFTFIMAPIMYLSAVLFSFYNAKEKGAFDIEMTCKYNLYQLSALRMFIFSLVSILINTVSIMIIYLIDRPIDVIRMIIISITGLFLFSTIFLYSLLKLRLSIAKYCIITSWIVVNIFLSASNNKVYQEFLIEAPLYIHLIISSICMVLYLKNLNKLINYRRNKGEI